MDGMYRRCRDALGKKAREARRCRVYCSGPACLLAGCSAEQHARERDFRPAGVVMEACDARGARGLEVVSELSRGSVSSKMESVFRAEGGGWNGKMGPSASACRLSGPAVPCNHLFPSVWSWQIVRARIRHVFLKKTIFNSIYLIAQRSQTKAKECSKLA